ncbi:MAG: hypothetical protein R3330_10015, partial [Saprospiraceae bacterium]|nr:hypothetical protein [Saprospiraceae bacterium]
AQQTKQDSDGLRHAIGLNATGLLDNLFNAEDREGGLPYLLTYELVAGRLVLRAGIGPEYTSETVVHEGFSDSQKRTDLQLDGRIGAGLRVLDEERWQLIAGVDITGYYGLEEITDDSGFDKITDEMESQRIGGGPFIQLSYQLSPRISLRTESALYINRYKETHTEIFENFPDFNNQLSKTTGTALDVHLPASLFVQFHF